MQKFERDYAKLVKQVLATGEERKTRNSVTKSLFGLTLKVDVSKNAFPVIQGRKMYPKGVMGELAAILRQPKHIDDFTEWGCNYWGKWANKDGSINVDYGNAWFDFNGVNQIAQLKESLANNPTDRRMIVTGWKPDGMGELNLPCCHCLYQFYVTKQGKLNMLWYQRSVDMMIGLPSDIVFAAAWLIAIAGQFGFTPGEITMSLGDCHVYKSHYTAAEQYVETVENSASLLPATYRFRSRTDFCRFEPQDIIFSTYPSFPKIDLELIA